MPVTPRPPATRPPPHLVYKFHGLKAKARPPPRVISLAARVGATAKAEEAGAKAKAAEAGAEVDWFAEGQAAALKLPGWPSSC